MSERVRFFDPFSILDRTIVVFVGANSQRKLDAVVDFLFYKQHIKSGIAFSDCDETEMRFRDVIPLKCLFRNVSTYVQLCNEVRQFNYTKQESYKTSAETRQRAREAIGANKHLHDAVLAQTNFSAVWKQSPIAMIVVERLQKPEEQTLRWLFREMFMNNRIFYLFTMFLIEKITHLGNVEQKNVDYFVIFDDSEETIQTLTKLHHFDALIIEQQVKKWIKLYGSIVVTVSGQIYPYKPKIHGPFMFDFRNLFDYEENVDFHEDSEQQLSEDENLDFHEDSEQQLSEQ